MEFYLTELTASEVEPIQSIYFRPQGCIEKQPKHRHTRKERNMTDYARKRRTKRLLQRYCNTENKVKLTCKNLITKWNWCTFSER